MQQQQQQQHSVPEIDLNAPYCCGYCWWVTVAPHLSPLDCHHSSGLPDVVVGDDRRCSRVQNQRSSLPNGCALELLLLAGLSLRHRPSSDQCR